LSWAMRRKREGWPQFVARWEASGKSAVDFGHQVGVSAATLSRWRREYRRGVAEDPGPALAKIVEVRSARAPADDRFEVRLGDGRSVGVPAHFDAAALERLLRVLEAAR
jgi:transposase-like protein